jgi:hypothetical protein
MDSAAGRRRKRAEPMVVRFYQRLSADIRVHLRFTLS